MSITSAVSTRSRAKAAGLGGELLRFCNLVSTRSRAKAAGNQGAI